MCRATGPRGPVRTSTLVVEALVAFLWVLAYYALYVEERARKSVAGLGVGLAYGTAILALAPITGASGNFARTFGAELSANLGGGPRTGATCGSTRSGRSSVASSRSTSTTC